MNTQTIVIERKHMKMYDGAEMNIQKNVNEVPEISVTEDKEMNVNRETKMILSEVAESSLNDGTEITLNKVNEINLTLGTKMKRKRNVTVSTETCVNELGRELRINEMTTSRSSDLSVKTAVKKTVCTSENWLKRYKIPKVQQCENLKQKNNETSSEQVVRNLPTKHHDTGKTPSAVNKRQKDRDRKALKRKNETAEERAIRLEQDKLAKRLKREDSTERRRRNERERLQQRKKREDPAERTRRNKYECIQRAKKRGDPAERTRRNERERLQQEKKREHPEEKTRRNERETLQQQRKREDSTERTRRNERERVQQKKKREDPAERSRRSERERVQRAKKREDPAEKKRRNERESLQQQKKRENLMERTRRNERECVQQEKKRKDPAERSRRNERERVQQAEKRENPAEKTRRNERESLQQQKKRENPTERTRRNEREYVQQEKKREDPAEKTRRNERERVQRAKKREDPAERTRRNERERVQQQKKREDPAERTRRNERERVHQRKKRGDPAERTRRNERERLQQEHKREHPEDKTRRNERESLQQQKKRQDPTERTRRNERERVQQEKKREDPAERTRQNERQRIQKRQQRQLPANWELAVAKFKRTIQNGPIYICTVCNRLLYKASVRTFCRDSYSQEVSVDTRTLSVDGIEYICCSCHQAWKAQKIPQLAIVNGLQLDDVPQQIEDLNSLEAVFISRRIPFMKILALPRGKQKAIHGCVVNIPIEPEELASVLPRVPSADSFITVKVKRKLMYRGHVFLQSVRPEKILTALHILKYSLKNPLYDDVVLNNYWMEDSCCNDSDLWNSLVSTAADESEPQILDNSEQDQQPQPEVEEQGEEEVEVEDERTRLSGLPYDSCIQPKDIVADQSHFLSIAPGEGKRPVSYRDDEHSEELSFPQLFPTGKFGYSYPREHKLTLRKYFQTRILNCDGRFARNIDYIFYAQYRTELKDVNDSISISLRKAREVQNVTAGEIKEKVSDVIRNDLGIHFLQKIRGSPAYFGKLFYDLLGMIRQLGPCTWFVTLSAADLKWPDTIRVIAKQQGINLSDEDIDRLSWEEKCKFLRTNPVTAARHFDYRVQQFWHIILMNNQLNPLGEIIDYKQRIEFQHRGSPHVHMLVWVKNAPTFENNTVEEIKDFVNGKLSCQLPEDDADLHDLLHQVQRHTHSLACRKHGKTCRFAFPRPPVNDTLVFKPLEVQPNSVMQEVYSTALTAVYEQLHNVDAKTTLEEVLQKAGVSQQLYITALHWIKTKSGQPAILLKRKPSEVNINNYNSIMMKGWQANLDVQFVTNVYSCVMYLASYISKPEKTLGDVLKAVSTASQHLGTRKSLKNVAHKFLTHREISAQEAVYRLLSLPLSRGSREVIFVPTDMPENRTRLLKAMALIENMDDDDPDIYQKSLLDRYSARPDSLNDICLAEFASNYRTSSKYSTKDDEDHVGVAQDQHDSHQATITLKDNMGKMTKRNTPAIIRSHQWSVKKNPESYFHAQLLLYFPWRNEVSDLLQVTYKDSYELKYDLVQNNRQNYEHHAEELADVLDDIEENGFPDDNWATVVPQTEQARQEEELEGNQEEPTVIAAYDTETRNTAAADAGLIPHEYVLTTEDVTLDDWTNMILSLNTRQYELHQFVVDWATTMLLSHTGLKPESFQIFLTGGAGVGKSFLVRTIVQTVKRLFARSNQVLDNHVLVCAPTGAAAYNIAGHTCHAAFQLRPRTTKQDEYIPLSAEKLAAMKDALCDIKLIIIDEVSMVSADMLLTIHRRLCDVMGTQKPFGGVSLLAVGDLMQLPPVAQKPVYSPPSDEIAAIYGSLWTSLFKIVELTEIQRQKGDQQFAALLNRVRVGDHNDDDMRTLKSREITKASDNYPKHSTHMFTTNRLRDFHNATMLQTVDQPHFTFKAKDSKKDQQTQMIEISSFDRDAGGLPSELTVAVGARVILLKNIDVSDGLVNSAAGVVVGFKPPWSQDQDIESYKPKYILVRFDDDRIGRKCRAESRGILLDPTATPIPTVEVPVYLSKKSSKVSRKRIQFPLTLAWGVTIHKEQGKTEDSTVVCCEGKFSKGQFYTAISRTRDMSGLYFLGEVTPNKIHTNENSLKEVNRMKKNAPFTPSATLSLTKSTDVFFKLQSLNIRSLLQHLHVFLQQNPLSNLHVVCFQETWLTSQDIIPDFPDFTCLRTDNRDSKQGHRQGGLLMFIRQDMRVVKQYNCENINVEYQMVVLCHVQDRDARLLVISLYNNPRHSKTAFLRDFEKLLQKCPQNIPTFIVGDLNTDIKRSNNKDLVFLTRYYGLKQHISQATHRQGGMLDLFFTNRDFADTVIDVIPTFYSDHLILSAAVPFQHIM